MWVQFTDPFEHSHRNRDRMTFAFTQKQIWPLDLHPTVQDVARVFSKNPDDWILAHCPGPANRPRPRLPARPPLGHAGSPPLGPPRRPAAPGLGRPEAGPRRPALLAPWPAALPSHVGCPAARAPPLHRLPRPAADSFRRLLRGMRLFILIKIS